MIYSYICKCINNYLLLITKINLINKERLE
jgi:hypothetical protein